VDKDFHNEFTDGNRGLLLQNLWRLFVQSSGNVLQKEKLFTRYTVQRRSGVTYLGDGFS